MSALSTTSAKDGTLLLGSEFSLLGDDDDFKNLKLEPGVVFRKEGNRKLSLMGVVEVESRPAISSQELIMSEVWDLRILGSDKGLGKSEARVCRGGGVGVGVGVGGTVVVAVGGVEGGSRVKRP